MRERLSTNAARRKCNKEISNRNNNCRRKEQLKQKSDSDNECNDIMKTTTYQKIFQ